MSEPVVVKGFEQPVTIKHQNTQLNQTKTSVSGKTHNGQKKCPYGFLGICMYVYIYNVYVYMYIYIIYICIYVYVCVYVYIYIYVIIYIYIYTIICI